MLALWTAQWLDRAERHPDDGARHQAEETVAVLTPLVKAYLTDCGNEVTNLGIQVLGGHGYIRANGQEQWLRDVRVTQIYEGTNGIQALDLLARKVLGDGGTVLRALLKQIEIELADRALDAGLAPLTIPVQQALRRLEESTDLLLQRSAQDMQEASAAACDYLRLMALTLTGALWSRAAAASRGSADSFHRGKRNTARFYNEHILPDTHSLLERLRAGAAAIMATEALG